MDLKSDHHFFSDILKEDEIPSNIDQVPGIVNLGVNLLLDATNFTSHSEFSIVEKILQKFIVLCLIKQLLETMTPEAVVTYCEELKPYFLELYFKKQSHFSLASLFDDILRSW